MHVFLRGHTEKSRISVSALRGFLNICGSVAPKIFMKKIYGFPKRQSSSLKNKTLTQSTSPVVTVNLAQSESVEKLLPLLLLE